jgi:hypothetical protein
MVKKFRFRCRLLLVWLIFAAALLPARGFSQAINPALGFRSPADTIRCWEVSCVLPLYDSGGRVFTSDTSARRLYVNSDLMMYVFSYGYATGIDGAGQTSSGTGHQYFIYQKDSLSGMRYDDHRPELNGHFVVESLKRSMVPYLKQFGLFKKGIGRLASTISHAASGQLVETYYDINWDKHPNSDSCYVTYSDRLNFLPREMSLDQTLDSLYQRKLCKFKMVLHPAPDLHNHRKFDRSEWIWALEEVHDFNRDNAKVWFSRYRHDTGADGP